MSKKLVRTTRVETEEVSAERKIPFGQLIDRYINETDYDESLDEYQYQISVQKYNEDGRPVTQTGRVYESLRDLPEDLGKRFGPARYRLFFQIYKDGKKVGFHRILDVQFDYDGDIQERHVEEMEPEELSAGQAWTIEQMRFAHEKELKQMEMNKEMFIAMMNAKNSGGGGLKSSDVIDLIQTGVAIASGQLPQRGSETGEDPDSLMNVLNNPLLKGLLGLLTAKTPPVAGPPPPPPPAGDPKIE